MGYFIISFEATTTITYHNLSSMPDTFDNNLKSLVSGLLEVDEKKRFTISQIRSHPYDILFCIFLVLCLMSSISWFSADLKPEDWIPLQVSTTSFTEDENGLVVLPAISPASLPSDPLSDPSIVPSLKSDKSYKEKCHCVIQ